MEQTGLKTAVKYLHALFFVHTSLWVDTTVESNKTYLFGSRCLTKPWRHKLLTTPLIFSCLCGHYLPSCPCHCTCSTFNSCVHYLLSQLGLRNFCSLYYLLLANKLRLTHHAPDFICQALTLP